MIKKCEGIFELFNSQVRRLQNGNKLRLIFECPEDIEIEKDLIEVRGCDCKVKVAPVKIDSAGKKGPGPVVIDGTFEVFDIKCRRLRNGDKLALILEKSRDKELEIAAVNAKFQECFVFLETVEEELDFDDDEE